MSPAPSTTTPMFRPSGTIIAANNVAVDFASTIDGGKLIFDPGAIFDGKVEVKGDTGVLKLAAETKAGTLAGFGSQFTGFEQVTIDNGATWNMSGDTTFAPGITLINDGTIAETSTDALTIDGNVIGSGIIILDPTTVTLNGSIDVFQQISFANDGDELLLDNASQFAGTITDFGAGIPSS